MFFKIVGYMMILLRKHQNIWQNFDATKYCGNVLRLRTAGLQFIN